MQSDYFRVSGRMSQATVIPSRTPFLSYLDFMVITLSLQVEQFLRIRLVVIVRSGQLTKQIRLSI